MASKMLQRIFSILLLAGMVFGFVQPGSVQASAPGAPEAQAVEKIEELVLKEISTAGTTDFFVWMTEKADLSPADQLQTKAEKGQFVYDTLVATAERSQKNLRAFLDGQGIQYQAFYISNKIFVQGGNLDLALTLAGLPDVAEITANHKYQLDVPFMNPAGPEGPTAVEANLTFINADDVWALGYTGQGTVMAGNDTGLDETHPAIARHYRGCIDPPACTTWDHNYNWWDATGTYTTNPYDGHGHGTHTTGTMVGDDGGTNQIGVAPGAQTVHCKNMTDGGSGDDTTFTTCFQWDLAPWDLSHNNPMPSLAPDAINNSWGYSGGNQNQFRDEIVALQAAGILVEVSAGNEGSSCATLRSPGDYTEVLTTGSVNHANPFPGTITGFSSRGPSDLDGNYFPDIMAPGENIRSSLPGNTYASWGGTSMAGPHATALVGLIWSACPAMTGLVDDTMEIIRDTAVPLTGQNGICGGDYTTGPNNDWGMGTIDALAAVQYAVGMCSGVGQLDGTVTDAVTADPLEGVSVTADWSGGGSWSQNTDVTGYYTFTAVPAGDYAVTFEHPMYTTLVANTTVVTDVLTTLDVDLTPRGLLSGFVTDADNGFALEGATVEADDGTTATTDVNGYYEMYLDEGTYDVTASMDDYAPETVTVSVVSGGATPQDFALYAAVSFLPSPLHVYVDWEGTASFPVTLTNRLPGAYDFEFTEIDEGFQPVQGGILSTWPGPDGFGYTGETLDYEWIDISTTGTLVPSLTDDSYTGPFNVGFTFPFYAGTQTQFYVSSNGFLSFGSGSSALTNQCPLPNATLPENVIPLMWDDLYPNYTTGGVYYQSFAQCPTGPGACLVVEYLNWNHYGGTAGSAGTFEAVLYDNGSVRMSFLDSGLELGSGSTTGIENANSAGDYGLTYACDTASSIVDNLSVCYAYPDSAGCVGENVPWFGELPLAGTVPADSSLEVTMLFTATAEVGVTQPGDYLATLMVLGDPGLRVPVTMTVQAGDDMGQLKGYVTDICTMEPVEALVEITNGDPISQTMSDPVTGYYSAWLFAGQYDTTFSAPGYLVFATTVDVPAGGELVLDVALVPDGPCAAVEPDMFEVWVMTGTAVYTDSTGLDLINMGGGELTFELSELDDGYANPLALAPATPNNTDRSDAEVAPASSKVLSPLALGDLLFEVDFQAATGDTQLLGVEFDGTYYWVTGGNSGVDPNKLYKIDTMGALIATTDQPAACTSWGGRDLAFDGDYLYFGCDNALIYQIDPATGLGTGVTFSGVLAPPRALAYDPATDHFWTANWDSSIYEIDRTGAIIHTFPAVGLSSYGMAWDPWSAGGPFLWLWSQDGPDPLLMASQVNPTTGALTGVSFLGSGVAGEMAGGATVSGDLVPGSAVFLGLTQGVSDRVGVYDLDAASITPDVPWLWENPITGTVPAEDMLNVDIMFTALYSDATPMPLGTYMATLRVKNNDPANSMIEVPVTMHIIDEAVAPTASFTADSPACQDAPMAIDNTSTPGVPPADYEWDFGDGTTSNEDEPGSHTYDAPGLYTITLTACNTAGCDVYSLEVEVLPLPVAGFDYAVEYLTVVFTNTSTDALSYLWDFGDGITDTVDNPVHTYAAGGTFAVTLWAFSDCGASMAEAVVTVVEPPNEADLSVTKTGPATVAVGETFTYTLTVVNLGPVPAVNTVLEDTLPAGVTFVSATTPCTEAGGVVTCALGDLAVDGTVVIEIVVTAPEEPGTLTNNATVASDTLDPEDSNNADSFDTVVELIVTTFETYLAVVFKN